MEQPRQVISLHSTRLLSQPSLHGADCERHEPELIVLGLIGGGETLDYFAQWSVNAAGEQGPHGATQHDEHASRHDNPQCKLLVRLARHVRGNEGKLQIAGTSIVVIATVAPVRVLNGKNAALRAVARLQLLEGNSSCAGVPAPVGAHVSIPVHEK